MRRLFEKKAMFDNCNHCIAQNIALKCHSLHYQVMIKSITYFLNIFNILAASISGFLKVTKIDFLELSCEIFVD